MESNEQESDTQQEVVTEQHANPRLSGVKVPLHKLIGCLGLPTDAKQQLKRIKKDQKVLEEALPNFEQARVRRIVGYKGAVKQVKRWEPVIKENRKTKVIFPENSAGVSIKVAPPSTKAQKPRTTLEEEVAKLLQANQEFLPEKRPLSVAEERALKAKSLEEAKIRRAQLLQQKALVSYYNAKMRRQNKIKSKSYRKILRKTRETKKAQVMEEMKNKDQASYKEWLKKEEYKRIQERMTLKHRGGSRTMSKKTKYAKYNEQHRTEIQDMIDKSKELTRKVSFFEELDDEDDDDVAVTSKEVTSRKRTLEDMEGSSDEEVEEDEVEQEEEEEEKVKEMKSKPEKTKFEWKTQEKGKKNNKKQKKTKKTEVEVDPQSFMKVERDLVCGDGDINTIVEDEEGIDVKSAQKRMTISEAFADDNVIEEFVQEKKKIIDQDKPKDIDLTLPGWGEWTGIGVPMSRKKRRRFIMKAPEIPRKDQDLPNVIISETKDTAIAKHQVSSLPHPHRNVPAFEKKIKKPIGKNWNPESTYRQLIRPHVVTRLGTVIKPISADAAR